jgi:hypothetical protein
MMRNSEVIPDTFKPRRNCSQYRHNFTKSQFLSLVYFKLLFFLLFSTWRQSMCTETVTSEVILGMCLHYHKNFTQNLKVTYFKTYTDSLERTNECDRAQCD